MMTEEDRDRIEPRAQAITVEIPRSALHEFNNLMSIVINYTTFVSEDVGEEHPSQSDLREVLEAAQRAAHLTSSLMNPEDEIGRGAPDD